MKSRNSQVFYTAIQQDRENEKDDHIKYQDHNQNDFTKQGDSEQFTGVLISSKGPFTRARVGYQPGAVHSLR